MSRNIVGQRFSDENRTSILYKCVFQYLINPRIQEIDRKSKQCEYTIVFQPDGAAQHVF